METRKHSRVILLSGAGSGIGRATALLLDKNGFSLSLTSRNQQKLDALQSELTGDHLYVAADVRNESEVAHWMNQTVEKWGKMDALVTNAGLGYFDPVEEGKLAEWHTMVDVNIKGLLNCIYHALPHLKKSEGAQLIQLGSVASHQVFPNSGVYCATKHAVLAISQSIHLEMAKDIRVTTISPGAVATPFIEQSTNDGLVNEMRDYFAAGLKPEDVANQILHALEQPEDVTLSEIIVRPKR
ncbi:SDR family oxidoreductase [bacterium SCSIO 12741]|nr:SDR family oxidoreductase [bacterium SCSIO 12741]